MPQSKNIICNSYTVLCTTYIDICILIHRASAEVTGTINKHTTASSLVAAVAGGAAITYSFASQQPVHAEAQAAITVETPSTAQQTSASGTTTDSSLDRYIIPSEPQPLPKEIILYQYEVCPFCNKVRAFLDYHNLPYRVVEVNPLTKAELKWSDYKKVPVILIDGKQQFNDSSAIISRLEADIQAADGSYKCSKKSANSGGWLKVFNSSSGSNNSDSTIIMDEEIRWRKWVDDWFVRVITVNIYRNAKESFQTFDYIADHGNFGWVQREAARVFGATLMWGISGRLKKKYGVEGDVRQVLYQSADEWIAAVGEKPYMGGAQPNLADLAVFGVLRSVCGTDTFNDVMHNSKIGGWYVRMMNAVGDSSRLSS